MDFTQFRGWVQGHVDAWHTSNYPDLPVFYEGAELPDQDNIGPRWLDVCVKYMDGEEVTVGNRPRVRDVGTVKLMLYTRQGEGTQLSDQILSSLREYFRTNNRAGNAKLGGPRPHSAPAALGWLKAGLLIPFKSDIE